MGASPWVAHHSEANQTAKSGSACNYAMAPNAIAPNVIAPAWGKSGRTLHARSHACVKRSGRGGKAHSRVHDFVMNLVR